MHEKAWGAWLNSTPGILGLLARRTKNLTYSAFPLANLRALPCPNPEAVNIQPLIDACDRLKGNELEALPHIAHDTRAARRGRCPSRKTRWTGAGQMASGDRSRTINPGLKLLDQGNVQNTP